MDGNSYWPGIGRPPKGWGDPGDGLTADEVTGASRAVIAILREQLERVTRERDQAVQVAVLVQTKGGRARRSLSTEEALGHVLEWLSDPELPVGSLVADAMAAHDTIRHRFAAASGPPPAAGA